MECTLTYNPAYHDLSLVCIKVYSSVASLMKDIVSLNVAK